MSRARHDPSQLLRRDPDDAPAARPVPAWDGPYTREPCVIARLGWDGPYTREPCVIAPEYPVILRCILAYSTRMIGIVEEIPVFVRGVPLYLPT